MIKKRETKTKAFIFFCFTFLILMINNLSPAFSLQSFLRIRGKSMSFICSCMFQLFFLKKKTQNFSLPFSFFLLNRSSTWWIRKTKARLIEAKRKTEARKIKSSTHWCNANVDSSRYYYYYIFVVQPNLEFIFDQSKYTKWPFGS